MRWQDAVRLSSLGAAERNASSNWKEPARVTVWTAKKSKRPCVMVRSGRWLYGGRRGDVGALSTKSASRFSDWEPVAPYPPLKLLAIAAQLEDEE